MTENQYNVIKQALSEITTLSGKKSMFQVAQSVGVPKYTYHKVKTKIITTKDYKEFCGVIAKTTTKVLTEKQYNEIKKAFKAGTPPAEIMTITKNLGLNKTFYKNFRRRLVMTDTYQEFVNLLENVEKKKAIVLEREQKAIREHTAKINAAILKKRKPKPKNKPNKAVNTKKAGMTTRAIKALIEEAEKQKALKDYADNLDSKLNAQDENQLSKHIRVQVGKTYYILERKDYDTEEKLEAFKEKKRLKEQQRIEAINKNLRKTPKEL